MPTIKKILIANRGVIAGRIARTCRELGIETIGVYTPHDPLMCHFTETDTLLEISDYMNAQQLIDLAQTYQAAIHPGYGFLSENVSFRKQCDQAGVLWIGPSANVLEKAGNKIACQQLLSKHGVPIIPSFACHEDHSDFQSQAALQGYPLLLKPAFGGGGVGMVRVSDGQHLERALMNARQVSQQHFGNQAILVEKYLLPARHIEVQLVADQHGHQLHLFERECSLQRRKQKVIEEGPSPTLSDAQRKQLYTWALQVGEVLGLDNVATIEFLLHEGQFYFLEANPRIQVEHGVTEVLTGVDLVEWQIRLAEGETLPRFAQPLNGHAIEARIYAEDPISGFPTPGEIHYLSLPTGHGIRLESSVWLGLKVAEQFDPLLLKVIAHGRDRKRACLRLQQALEHLDINGTLQVNTSGLLATVQSQAFQNGTYHTESYASLSQRHAPDVSWEYHLAEILVEQVCRSSPNLSESTRGYQGGFWKPTYRRT